MAEIKPQVYKDPRPAEYFTRFHERARTRDPDWVYTVVRMITTYISLIFYRLRSIGVENIPESGAVIFAPNHFSQMDHFFAGVYTRRQIRFMAKSQLFTNPVLEFIFSHGGVFPMRRGHRDEESFKTVYAILGRGGCMLMYPEGGRSRSGGLGEPKPGLGRIALESGVPVVPIAIHGSSGVRGWRKLRFPKITVQYGEPVSFPITENPTREQQIEVATAVFDRVKAMYDALDARGRRGVIKAIRDGVPADSRADVTAPGAG